MIKLTQSIIKNFTAKDYIKYRKEIKMFYYGRKEVQQALARKKKPKKEIYDKKKDPYYVIEQKFIDKINSVYWSNRKKSEKTAIALINKPWFQHKKNAKSRCLYKKDKKYKYYGGRGIKYIISNDDLKMLWIRDKAYLMQQPSIHRIDNDGNYTYENCQFIEMDKHRLI